MTRFTLVRRYLPLGTKGWLYDPNGWFVCFTVERSQTGDHPCIPEGTYTAKRYDSPKHGPNTWQLENVPNRTNIQFHVANWPRELLGCIAPGEYETKAPNGEPGVLSSRAAYGKFMALTEGEDEIQFTITKERLQ